MPVDDYRASLSWRTDGGAPEMDDVEDELGSLPTSDEEDEGLQHLPTTAPTVCTYTQGSVHVHLRVRILCAHTHRHAHRMLQHTRTHAHAYTHIHTHTHTQVDLVQGVMGQVASRGRTLDLHLERMRLQRDIESAATLAEIRARWTRASRACTNCGMMRYERPKGSVRDTRGGDNYISSSQWRKPDRQCERCLGNVPA